MRTRVPLVVVLIALGLLAGLALWRVLAELPQPGRLELAGDVVSDERIVRAPVTRSATSAAAARAPQVSGTLERMLVADGDPVTTGQVLAQLDTTLLRLGVDQARAAARKAQADADVLGGRLGDIADKEAELADARGELAAARAKLLSARADLVAQIAEVEAMMAAPRPPTPPTGAPSAQDPRAVLATLRAALAQVDSGLARTASARSRLNAGASQLEDAKAQASGAREVLSLVAKAREAGIGVAEARLAQATVRSPVTGVVTDAGRAGTVVMAGAPIVRIRPAGPTRVDTFVTPEQLAGVSLGSQARVDFDSNRGTALAGRVTRIGEVAEFPPASFPTAIVHMTRTVRVTITLDGDGWAPPGTPADVRILTEQG